MVTLKRREGMFISVLVIGACVAAFGFGLALLERRNAGRVEREDAALSLLKTLAVDQHSHLKASGQFVWIDALARPEHTVQRDEIGSFLQTGGYRFDVLLPSQRQVGPPVLLAPQSANTAHPDLRKQHFALVARPTVPGKTGFRTYYIDETGFPWQNEGVSDERMSTRNALPGAHLTTSEGNDLSARVWTRADLMVPRGRDEWEKRRKK